MNAIASQITSPTIVYSGAYQSKHQSSASLAFVWEIHRRPVNSPHKGPVTRKCFHLMTSSWYANFMWWSFVTHECKWAPVECHIWCPMNGNPNNKPIALLNFTFEISHQNIFSCDQAALRTIISVCPSVCLSVCPSLTPDNVPLIVSSWIFQWVITIGRHDVLAKGQGQRSKVKVTEVMTPLSRFRTVTPVWIHIWWWNDAQTLMLLRRGTLLFLKVICQISRSHG